MMLDIENKSKEVARLTGENEHTLAYITICNFCGLIELEEDFKKIADQQEVIGHLPYELYEDRKELYNKMNKQGKELLGEVKYNKYFYSNT